jgi:hypothetical protein
LSRRRVLAILSGAPLAGCEFPVDSAGSLERVRSGAPLRVGASHAPPWVRIEGDAVGGIEAELIRSFAQHLGSTAQLLTGGEAPLMSALQERHLDAVVAGLTDTTPWSSHGALSQPYLTTSVRFGLRADAAAPEDWRDKPVAVAPEHVLIAALVEAEGARPVSPSSETPVAVAGYDFHLQAVGLRPVGPELRRERHVIAVAGGQSALLLALDRFLLGVGQSEVIRRARAIAP